MTVFNVLFDQYWHKAYSKAEIKKYICIYMLCYNLYYRVNSLKAVTDLGSSDQPVALCTAVQVVALKQLLLHKHVPQTLLQAGHAANTHRQVQKVLLQKTQTNIYTTARLVRKLCFSGEIYYTTIFPVRIPAHMDKPVSG